MHLPSDWFREWFDSPYYHQLYFGRDENEAAGLINRLLSLLKPPQGSAMLDVACGRGRHSRILASHGYDVTGFDLAPESIAFARQFENEHLRFFVHDMRRILCTNCFDYAFNFFTSFGYFHTQREHDNALKAITLALKPGGYFFLDYLNTHYAEDHLIHRSQKEIDGVIFYLTKWYDEHHFYKKIEIEDETQKEPIVYTEKVAKFSIGDFTEMFALAGLSIQHVFGSYQLEPYHIKTSPRLLLVAQKRPSHTVAGDGRRSI